jgi:ketosteroid isomerase-like protein
VRAVAQLGVAVAMAFATAACEARPTANASASASAQGEAMTTKEAERDIGAMLDDWHAAAARADEAAYFGHFAPDGVFLGTDATERWDVPAFRAYAKAPFAKGKAWSFKATRRAVIVDPSLRLAWFDEDLETVGLGPARGSGVVRRDAGAWKIAHYNLTITVPNERFDEVKRLLASPPKPGGGAP